MRWPLHFISAVFGLLASPATAQDAISWVLSSNYSDSHLVAKITSKLNEPSPVMGQDEALPLREVMSRYPLAILIDERALEADNVTPDEPIAIPNVPGISIRNQLKYILGPLQLTFVEKPGYLLITSKKSSANVIGLYDVTSYVSTATGKYDFSPLIRIIEQSIADDSWQNAGGTSNMTEWRTPTSAVLVVNAPDETHEAIRDLFSAKRELLLRASRGRSSRRLQSTEIHASSVRRSSLQKKAD